MAGIERSRDVMRGAITAEYLESRMREGWRAVAVEWERPSARAVPATGEDLHEMEVMADAGAAPELRLREEVPFGLRVAGDCLHLEENPAEMETLASMMELMIQDISLTRVAEELQRRGMPTRDGSPWTAATVFRLLPRVIDVAPRIFSGAKWELRRKRLTPVTWNS